jgi:hypothetical protein
MPPPSLLARASRRRHPDPWRPGPQHPFRQRHIPVALTLGAPFTDASTPHPQRPGILSPAPGVPTTGFAGLDASGPGIARWS